MNKKLRKFLKRIHLFSKKKTFWQEPNFLKVWKLPARGCSASGGKIENSEIH
ncbi:hypothetical protein KKD19_05850 [Patescibacteria group bacterium]|nr:hypothetical protein [Patescibacteria group bacterium]